MIGFSANHIAFLTAAILFCARGVTLSADTPTSKPALEMLFQEAAAFEQRGEYDRAITLYQQMLSLTLGGQPGNGIEADGDRQNRPIIDEIHMRFALAQSAKTPPAFDQAWTYIAEAEVGPSSYQDAPYRVLFREMKAAATDQQMRIWSSRVELLPKKKISLSISALAELDEILGDHPDPHDSFGDRLLDEMLRLPLSDAGRVELQSRLEMRQMRKRLALPAATSTTTRQTVDTQRVLLSAMAARRRGELSQAIKIYSDLLDDESDNLQITNQVRRLLIEVQLEQSPPNWEAAQVQFDRMAAGRPLEEDLWNIALRILIQRVAGSDPRTQLEIWKTGLSSLTGDEVTLNAQSLADLDVFADSLPADSALRPVGAIAMLLDEGQGSSLSDASCDELKSRLEARRMRSRLASPPATGPATGGAADMQRKLLLAIADRRAGKTAEAMELYSEILENSAENPQVANVVRRLIIELKLEQIPADVDGAQEHFEKLTAGHPLKGDLWSIGLRILMRRVASSNSQSQIDVWRKGLAALSGDEILLDPQAFVDLENFANALSENKSLLVPTDLLADVMLLAPPRETLRWLQEQRAAHFVRAKAMDEALAATRLRILLDSLAEQGPLPAVKAYQKLLADSGASEEANIQIWQQLLKGESSGSVSDEIKRWYPPPVDASLRARATEFVEEQSSGGFDRRIIIAMALAGRGEEAATIACRSLVFTASSSDLVPTMEDISLLFAMLDGDIEQSDRFVQWLSSTTDSVTRPVDAAVDPLLMNLIGIFNESFSENERVKGNRQIGISQAAAEVVERSEQRRLSWIARAAGEGDPEAAKNLCISAINAGVDTKRVLDHLAEQAQGLRVERGAKSVAELYAAIADRLDSPHQKREARMKIASLYFEDGAFQQCLAELDSADKIYRDKQTDQDMDAGFMRAISYTRMRQFDEAQALLKKMTAWPGTAEQRARAEFLVGWTQLQFNDRTAAIASFQRVVDQYPESSFAAKAGELITQLRGI